MAIFSKEEAKRILEKVISFSKADGIEANLNGSNGGNIRYARNTVSTSGEDENAGMSRPSASSTQRVTLDSRPNTAARRLVTTAGSRVE